MRKENAAFLYNYSDQKVIPGNRPVFPTFSFRKTAVPFRQLASKARYFLSWKLHGRQKCSEEHFFLHLSEVTSGAA